MIECGFEDRVRDAARTGRWSEDLRDHCAACEPCAETTLVTAALSADSETLDRTAHQLPDPRVIWMRARLEKRQQKSMKAVRGIVWFHRIAIACAMVFGIVVAPRFLSVFSNSFGSIHFESLMPRLPLSVAGPALVLVVSFGVLGLMAMWNEVVEER